MTAKTRRRTAIDLGFKNPGDYSYHYDGSVRKKGSVARSLLRQVETSIYRRQRRLRRGPTTMHARKPSRWTETNRYRTVPYRTVTRITPRNTHNTHNTRSHATRGCDTFGGVAA